MRFEGKIIGWDDRRGVGYIVPDQGGQNIFVHITAFRQQATRPSDGLRVSFEVESRGDGKKRAKKVALVRQVAPRRVPRVASSSNAPRGTASLLTIPAFCLLYAIIWLLWRPPTVVAIFYLSMSVGTFIAYAADKSAAKSGAWRIAESKLHLGALLGGWPGALLAQQLLRHKSSKRDFRSTFWFTAVVNVVGFIGSCSPLGQQLIRH